MNGDQDQQSNMFQPGMESPEHKGSMIGTIIVILIIVVGVIYLLASRGGNELPPVPATTGESEQLPSDNSGSPETVAPSDDLSGLENELGSGSSAEETDQLLNQFDAELVQ